MIYQFFGGLLFILSISIFLYILKSDNVKVESKLAKNILQREKMNSDDFRKNKEYFRDIVGQYSPTLLSYIDDFNLDLPRDIIGNIIILEQKGYIKVNNGIFVNENKNIEDTKLTKIEKYLLKNVINGNIIIDYNIIKCITQQEGLEKKLLTVHNSRVKNGYIEFGLISFVVIFNLLKDFLHLNVFGLNIILSIILIGSVASGLVKMMYGIEKNKDSFYRTTQGEDINQKLEGLKIFLKDYGDMKSKEAEMITLWNDFLIYSIIFRQNNIAISKYQKYIKIKKQ